MELLPRIAALYTMAQEREVHAVHLPPAFVAAVRTPVMALEDDDDDGLF